MTLENGYETFTTFETDFAIADVFGVKAIRDTYKRAMREWKKDYKYLTELVLILNFQCWRHYYKGNTAFSLVYQELFYDARNYAYKHLKGEELSYFYDITD